PSCAVDGCKADLSKCRDYHRRHKVCEAHSKTPLVVVAGREMRFCQQCSRFHLLAEFDEAKRSCRKRLDGHNRRRRKPQVDSMNSGSFMTTQQGSVFKCRDKVRVLLRSKAGAKLVRDHQIRGQQSILHQHSPDQFRRLFVVLLQGRPALPLPARRRPDELQHGRDGPRDPPRVPASPQGRRAAAAAAREQQQQQDVLRWTVDARARLRLCSLSSVIPGQLLQRRRQPDGPSKRAHPLRPQPAAVRQLLLVRLLPGLQRRHRLRRLRRRHGRRAAQRRRRAGPELQRQRDELPRDLPRRRRWLLRGHVAVPPFLVAVEVLSERQRLFLGSFGDHL
uniref:SBP-type domain-containing protein n=1 Tax=Aegilops tauschii subsp. strangulata TaxID=200361 RepID=A0A453L8E0_AEGTS